MKGGSAPYPRHFRGSLTKLSLLWATSATSCGRDAVACARDGCLPARGAVRAIKPAVGHAVPFGRSSGGKTLFTKIAARSMFGIEKMIRSGQFTVNCALGLRERLGSIPLLIDSWWWSAGRSTGLGAAAGLFRLFRHPPPAVPRSAHDMLADADERVSINRRVSEITISFGGDTYHAAQFARSVPDFVLTGRFADLVKLDLQALEQEMEFDVETTRPWWRRLIRR